MKHIGMWIVVWYLRVLARAALLLHAPYIIGIAGSVGKSSARNALFAVIREYYPVKTVGNSETGIPLGILGIVPDGYSFAHWVRMLLRAPLGILFLRNTKFLIVEMGIDDPFPPKNMEYLLTILKPRIALSLNVSCDSSIPPHAMQFEKVLSDQEKVLSSEEKNSFVLDKMAQEDTKIITKSGCAVGIYNASDNYIRRFVKDIQHTKLLSFGRASSDIISTSYEVGIEGSRYSFDVNSPDLNGSIMLTFSSYILPKEYEDTFASVILAAGSVGLTLSQIKHALEKNLTLPKGRSSVLPGINNSIIIDSSYNASGAAVSSFLELVKTLKMKTGRPVVFLFGDMRELGSFEEQEHKAIALKISSVVDALFCVGDLTKKFVIPFVDRKNVRTVQWFKNSREAGKIVRDLLPKHAIVLVKGSQNTIFLEEAVYLILKNKEDATMLCRQEYYWKKIKEDFFRK